MGVASKSLRFEILKRDSFRCFYCGRSAPDGAELHVDHVVPRAAGGTDDPANLVTACADCNLGKNARELHLLREDVATPLDTAIERARAAREFALTQATAIDANGELVKRLTDEWLATVSNRVPPSVAGSFNRLVSEVPMEDLMHAIEVVARQTERRACNSQEHRSRLFYRVVQDRKDERAAERMTPEQRVAKAHELANHAFGTFRSDVDSAIKSARSGFRMHDSRWTRVVLARALCARAGTRDLDESERLLMRWTDLSDGYCNWQRDNLIGLIRWGRGQLESARAQFEAVLACEYGDGARKDVTASCLRDVCGAISKRDDERRAEEERKAALREQWRQHDERRRLRAEAAEAAGVSYCTDLAYVIEPMIANRDFVGRDEILAAVESVELARYEDRSTTLQWIGQLMGKRGFGWTSIKEGKSGRVTGYMRPAGTSQEAAE